MNNDPIRGLCTAVSTPVDSNGSIDQRRFSAHALWLLENGVDGICPFGTTGEGIAFSVSEKTASLDALSSEVSPTRMMPVVGANALRDAYDLVSHAHRLGCPGVLLLPPSYFKNPSDEGVFEFYARVIDRVNDGALRLFVYNIPQITGVVIEHPVVEQLITRFGPVIAGVKDSWGNLDRTLAYIKAFPGLAVFTGTDHHIVESMRAGGAGTVTGMGNVNPVTLREVIDTYETPQGEALGHVAGEVHLVVEKYGGVPAMKAVIAHYRDDGQWEAMTPPLVSISSERQADLIAALSAAGHVWPDGD